MKTAILIAEQSRQVLEYLYQFFDDVHYVSPRSYEPVDLLIIPSTNVFSGFESYVDFNGTLSPQIDALSRTFFENVLDKYIESNTKILALGNSADMLWVKLGGTLEYSYQEALMLPVLGEYEQSPLNRMVPKLGTSQYFFETQAFPERFFELRNRPQDVSIISRLSTFKCRKDYLSKVREGSSVDAFIVDSYACFEHSSHRFYGVKSNPLTIYNRPSSKIYEKFGDKVGNPMTNTIIKMLRDGCSDLEEVQVPVA